MIKVNGKEIGTTLFPNNEVLVDTTVLNEEISKDKVRIEWQYHTSNDLIELLFVLGHYKDNRKLSQAEHVKDILIIQYMPYSRMDRDQIGNIFSLKHVCNMIWLMQPKYLNIFIVEPHSKITEQRLYCFPIKIIPELAKRIEEQVKFDIICYPDKGAAERYKDCGCKYPIVYCKKVRDFETGEIKGLELINQNDINLKDKNVLILDDLCSAGGTFYHTGNKLKEYGVNNIYLGICHMEHTIYRGKLFDKDSPITKVFATNTMGWNTETADYNPKHNDKLVQFDIESFENYKRAIRQ
jgi:ribose-phosphate pyrophosphokinase